MSEPTKFDPTKSVPIVYGMHYPGIVLVFGTPYNDRKVRPPCYRVGDDPRVGYNTAKWVATEDEDTTHLDGCRCPECDPEYNDPRTIEREESEESEDV